MMATSDSVVLPSSVELINTEDDQLRCTETTSSTNFSTLTLFSSDSAHNARVSLSSAHEKEISRKNQLVISHPTDYDDNSEGATKTMEEQQPTIISRTNMKDLSTPSIIGSQMLLTPPNIHTMIDTTSIAPMKEEGILLPNASNSTLSKEQTYTTGSDHSTKNHAVAPKDTEELRDDDNDQKVTSDSKDGASRRKDRIPAWAKGPALEKALKSQPLDTDTIFGRTQHINLEEVFASSRETATSSSSSHTLKSKYWQESIQILSPQTPIHSPRRKSRLKHMESQIR
jgi:hypothetical protein